LAVAAFLPQSLSLQPRKRDAGCLVDTINATVIEIGNDGENIYHIVLEALIPRVFGRISINEGVLGGRSECWWTPIRRSNEDNCGYRRRT
jgi:hypothetical protein